MIFVCHSQDIFFDDSWRSLKIMSLLFCSLCAVFVYFILSP